MLRNIKFMALLLGLGLMASTAALAQAPAANAAAPTGKIGIVGIREAIAATNEGQKEMETLQKRFGPKQNELKTLNDEIEALKKQLQTQGDKLSEEARSNGVKNLEVKQKTLQRNYEDYQNEVQQAEGEVVNRLGAKMMDVMQKYATVNGYSLILDVSNPETTPVLWASQSTNISQALVDAYNAQSPVQAPAKPAGAAAAKPAGTAPAPKKP